MDEYDILMEGNPLIRIFWLVVSFICGFIALGLWGDPHEGLLFLVPISWIFSLAVLRSFSPKSLLGFALLQAVFLGLLLISLNMIFHGVCGVIERYSNPFSYSSGGHRLFQVGSYLLFVAIVGTIESYRLEHRCVRVNENDER